MTSFVKSNYHTHTTYCDGKNSPEEMILGAISSGLNILGFSGHSMYPFACDWHIAPREHKAYSDEIKALAKKYSGKIEVYCGFEADFIEGMCCPDMNRYEEFSPDFLIGSVHYVFGDKGFYEADGNINEVPELINQYFGGNVKKAVQAYFAAQRSMLEKGNFMFWGHPDLIRKQNSKKMLFDETESWYKDELKLTAKAAAKAGVCAELNTGGIARGYLETPYPSPYFLELLHQNNVPVTINSDSHNADTIDFWFENAIQYIKKAGYTETMFYTTGSLKSQNI